MDFFIDSANVEEVDKAYNIGIIDGVTTNPSLIAKENESRESLVCQICDIVDGPVSVEVNSLDVENMLKEGKELAALSPKIVVKIPMTLDGLKVVSQLSREGVKTNVTLVFSPMQALLAAKVGATYVSPFVGRLDDLSHNGIQLIEQIMSVCKNYTTKIIVASIRSPMHILNSALLGAHVATIPFNVIEKLVMHPLTKDGLDLFMRDWSLAKK